MASVLITGTSGLIGREVLAHWPDDLVAIPLDRADVDLLAPGSFAAAIRATRPSAVVHLAWVASSTPGYRSHPDNAAWCDVSAEAARACDEVGARFVAVGTGLDSQPGDDPYTASKRHLRAELAGEIASGDVTWLRPFYVFDPKRETPSVLQAAMEARRSNRPVELASPDATHDFVHVTDVATGIIAAVANGLGGVVDIGSGRLHTVRQLVEACDVAWTTAAPDAVAVAHNETAADVSALRETGWAPTTTETFFADA